MLPDDTSARKKTSALSRQGTLDAHLRELPPTEQVARYTDDIFREASIEWLVSTDQVFCVYILSAFASADVTTSPFKRSSTSTSRR